MRIRRGPERWEYEDLPHGVSEDAPLDFHSPYGCSKGSADQYVLDYARVYGLRTVCFRQSCIYGPFQRGTEDQGWVAHFALRALEHQNVTIYGDGRQVRDLLHVGDLVQLYEIGLHHAEVAPGRAFNIGGGPENALSLIECLAELERLLGRAIPFEFADWRPGDQRVFISDNRRTAQELGWRPSVRAADGLAELVDWLRTHGSGPRSAATAAPPPVTR